jgi:predicted transcriptional regulator
MEADRHIHKTRNGTFHITGPGEHFLTGSLVDLDFFIRAVTVGKTVNWTPNKASR